MSNCKILKDFEHFHTSRESGIPFPPEYASILKKTIDFSSKAIMKRIMTDPTKVEEFYANCPMSENGYNGQINYPGIKEVNLYCISTLEKFGLKFNDNQLINNNLLKSK